MNYISSLLTTTGQALVGLYFLFYGFWNIWHGKAILAVMKQKNIPKALLVLIFGIVWQSVAGVLLIIGYGVPWAALSLIPFTLIAVFSFHPFWTLEGQRRTDCTTIFITNLTVTLGALLLLVRT